MNIYIKTYSKSKVSHSRTKKQMNGLQESFKQKKDKIFKMLKEISDKCGGDDPQWLNEYSTDVVKSNINHLQDIFDLCCRVIETCPRSHPESINIVFKQDFLIVCPTCNYRPPFCFYLKTKKCSNLIV